MEGATQLLARYVLYLPEELAMGIVRQESNPSDSWPLYIEPSSVRLSKLTSRSILSPYRELLPWLVFRIKLHAALYM